MSISVLKFNKIHILRTFTHSFIHGYLKLKIAVFFCLFPLAGTFIHSLQIPNPPSLFPPSTSQIPLNPLCFLHFHHSNHQFITTPIPSQFPSNHPYLSLRFPLPTSHFIHSSHLFHSQKNAYLY